MTNGGLAESVGNIFIIGTDTGVGKTWVTLGLMAPRSR